MHNLKYLTCPDDGRIFDHGRMRLLERAAGFLFVVVLALLPVGCLIGNDDYDQASRERDDYRSRLQTMRLANDQLHKDISILYNECDNLNSQLSVLAALSIHNSYTEDLRRAEPVAAPPPPARSSRRAPAVAATPPPSRPRVNPGAPSTGAGRESGGSRGAGSQQRGGGQGGSAVGSSPPPPPPSRSGGAIDWGL